MIRVTISADAYAQLGKQRTQDAMLHILRGLGEAGVLAECVVQMEVVRARKTRGRAAGGRARAASMTPEQRREQAKKAAQARWGNR